MTAVTENYLRPAAVARLLSVSRPKIYRWVEKGVLRPPVRALGASLFIESRIHEDIAKLNRDQSGSQVCEDDLLDLLE